MVHLFICCTVVPVMNGHPRDQAKVSLHDRWPGVRGHRCQPSRNRAGNAAFLCISRIPAFFRERPAFLALFWETNFLNNCDHFRRQKETLCVMVGPQ